MHIRNKSTKEALKEVGVSDKTLNEYGDVLQASFPSFAGGLKRRRMYNEKELAMLREFKIRRSKGYSDLEIISDIHAIFYESTIIVLQ